MKARTFLSNSIKGNFVTNLITIKNRKMNLLLKILNTLIDTFSLTSKLCFDILKPITFFCSREISY